mmetsp:Transcript_22007/g.39701  ORF Transcript_22007/g.39701 Transcript_22007/m.39701 type:complete len:88 (+) Transcript_22007:555-818(+)
MVPTPGIPKNMAGLPRIWCKRLCLEHDIAQAAGSFGFGARANNATEHNDSTFDESVNVFVAAHNSMQTTIKGLTATNQQLASMNQHL